MQRDLNNTLIFVKVVEHGSFTAAARALALPSSTVSRRMRELEESLGARLINRTTRRLALTQAGAVYYEHCRRIAVDLDEAESAVHQLEASPRGWLRVTAPYTFGATTLAPILRDFRLRYPEVRLEVVLSNERLDLVAEGIDVAIRVGDMPDSTLVARRLVSYPTRVFASEGYLARHGEPRTPDDLMQHHALVVSKFRRGQRYVWPLRQGDSEQEFEVAPVVVANDPQMLLGLLMADHGVMLINEMEIFCFAHAPGVRQVLPDWQGPDIDLHAVFVGGRALSPKVRAFVDFVADELQAVCAGTCATNPCRLAWPQPMVECAAANGVHDDAEVAAGGG